MGLRLEDEGFFQWSQLIKNWFRGRALRLWLERERRRFSAKFGRVQLLPMWWPSLGRYSLSVSLLALTLLVGMSCRRMSLWTVFFVVRWWNQKVICSCTVVLSGRFGKSCLRGCRGGLLRLRTCLYTGHVGMVCQQIRRFERVCG